MPLSVEVVTPEREVSVCDDATMVIAKGIEGDLGILPGRAPALIALGVGPVRIDREGGRQDILVDGGFLQVKDDKVIVLAEYAVLPAEADPTAVAAEVEELRRRIEAEEQTEALRKQLARAEALHNLIRM